MAETFFGFDASVNHALGTDEPDCHEAEEDEYDALNDETFGGLDSDPEDWERQHEHLSKIAETSRQLENSIGQLGLDDDDVALEYPNESTKCNGEPPAATPPPLPVPARASDSAKVRSAVAVTPKKICTVEELERGLMTPRAPKPPPQPAGFPSQLGIHHPMFPGQQLPRLPPGIHPMSLSGPPMRNLTQLGLNSFPVLLPPGYPPPGLGPSPAQIHHPHHHRLLNNPFPVNHPLNFVQPPPPPQPPNPLLSRLNQTQPSTIPPPQHPQHPLHQQQQQQQQLQQQQQQQQRPLPTTTAVIKPLINQTQQQQQQQQHQHKKIGKSNNSSNLSEKDEYSGLMTNRDKQWLLNIQLLQLNTGTPYFDDYYYTVYKSRNNKEKEVPNDHHHHRVNNGILSNRKGNRERHDSNSSQREIIQARVYTPLQFENSLGKLQCGSVTAPRKIIDTDIVTLDNGDNSTSVSEKSVLSRDSRRTKQILLELESFYALLLKMEDLRNPTAIANLEKLRELKQKQRLRELEAAQTPEQKQEIFKLLQKEGVPVEENPNDYLVKLIAGLTQEDKYVSFFNVRKGKALLLRVLPHLTNENFKKDLLDLWIKILVSVPIVGRRDSAGDNLLPKLHPFFKRFAQMCVMSNVIEIVTNISEAIKPDQSCRSTPSSYQGRAPLNFLIANKLGVSTLATLIVRSEYLISSGNATAEQRAQWFAFVSTLADLCATTTSSATPSPRPLEPVPAHTFRKHCGRWEPAPERRAALEARLAETT